MEGLGEKFQRARKERNLTLEEAARMTKIRPAKLAEIEAEDFSQFPSLAYAKGFILIYGKFLNVDVSPYLEAFETSEGVTVDGYSYLQDNPAPPPRRTEVVRKVPSGSKNSLMPLLIGIVVLVVGFSLLKFMMNVRRIKPGAADSQTAAPASPGPTLGSGASSAIIAPRALPADRTPAPTPPTITSTPVIAEAAPSAPPVASPQSTVQMAAATSPASQIEDQEVRRAEPVHPEDLAKAQAAGPSPTPSPSPTVNRFEVRPLRKTYVRVVVDGAGRSTIERWVDASEGLQFRGRHIAIKVLDPSDVEIRKNGKVVSRGDADVSVE
jgi:cytoskeleton protein RodZ